MEEVAAGDAPVLQGAVPVPRPRAAALLGGALALLWGADGRHTVAAAVAAVLVVTGMAAGTLATVGSCLDNKLLDTACGRCMGNGFGYTRLQGLE